MVDASHAHIILAPGTPVTGIWCDECWTSAIVSVPIGRITAAGVAPFSTWRRCLTCDPIEGVGGGPAT